MLSIYLFSYGSIITVGILFHFSSALYCLEVVDQNIVITGDEDGVIKVWDRRQMPNAVAEFKENDDYISDMVCHSDRKNLLVTRSV